jgi:hypothetical protein
MEMALMYFNIKTAKAIMGTMAIIIETGCSNTLCFNSHVTGK